MLLAVPAILVFTTRLKLHPFYIFPQFDPPEQAVGGRQHPLPPRETRRGRAQVLVRTQEAPTDGRAGGSFCLGSGTGTR